jgi:imidazolonepropionase-like amidohydrolase
MKPYPPICLTLVAFFVFDNMFAFQTEAVQERHSVQPINMGQIEVGKGSMVIVNANLIDLDKREVKSLASVLIEDGVIQGVGSGLIIPESAEVFDAGGSFLLPGLIDVHFHLDQLRGLPGLYLQKGITSIRDPGAWIGAYGAERRKGDPLPRLYLTGPHLDMHPPAHPRDAIIVRDAEEGKAVVRKMAQQGASAIKVYFRLPLGTIKAVCEEAHALGLPVTAHLEISDVREVIAAGVDGIEHVTSLGLSLLPLREAEVYRQKVLADNEARREGRYEIWGDIDPDAKELSEIFELMKSNGVYFCPTLAIFEKRYGQQADYQVNAFNNMMQTVKKAHEAGVKITVGSHSYVPYADFGEAYVRELELLNECGMDTFEVLMAATSINAHFLKAEKEIGAIEVGKWADLVLFNQNPVQEISNFRSVERVMQAGKWVME